MRPVYGQEKLPCVKVHWYNTQTRHTWEAARRPGHLIAWRRISRGAPRFGAAQSFPATIETREEDAARCVRVHHKHTVGTPCQAREEDSASVHGYSMSIQSGAPRQAREKDVASVYGHSKSKQSDTLPL